MSAAVVALPGSSSPDSDLALAGQDTTELRGLEDLRREAADDPARGSERSPEPESTPREKPAEPEEPEQPTATIVPPEPDGPSDDEPSDDDPNGDEAGDGADEPRSQLPGGFAPVPGCAATVPGEGSVANGELTEEYLCDVGDGFLLRPDAGAAFLALADTYADSTGDSLLSCIGNSYRTYDEQVELYGQKPGLAAEPGTSEHGWGLAIDFECGANSYSSSFYAWLDANGPGYGWTNPPWAQPGGSRPEPWHWEFDPSLPD